MGRIRLALSFAMAKMTNEKEMYQIYWAFPSEEEADKVKNVC